MTDALAAPSRLSALAFLDRVPRTPALVCCPFCREPLEARPGAPELDCACLAEPEACRCSRVDFDQEGRSLSDEDLVLLGERYGWLDGRPKSVVEVARARRTTRRRVRELEGEAMRRLRELVLAAVRRSA